MRYIFNVHIDAVQIVLFHRPGDLLRQLPAVLQGGSPQFPVPVVAQKGDHPHPLLVHLGDKAAYTAAGEIQAAVGIEIKIIGGNLVQGALGLLNPLNIGGGVAEIEVGHAEPPGISRGGEQGAQQQGGAAQSKKAWEASHMITP